MKILNENQNFTAVNIGPLEDQTEKVFVKEATKATGTEISFQKLMPGTEVPFLHSHKENEETYIILKGSGEFQVDGKTFPVTEGSIVRVSPDGLRVLRSSNEPMLYMVIQSKENSLNQYSSTDGILSEEKINW